MRLLQALLASTFALTPGAAPAEWIQLTPAGQFVGRDGRPGEGRSWSISDSQGQALAADFNAIAAQTPVVVDFDHQTLYVAQTGQKAPAAGWMDKAEWRPGSGLWAHVKWTAAAAQHVTAGEYLYVSPVLLYDEKTLEVRRVAMAALVNYPALLGMHPAVAALATQFPQEKDMNPILAALLKGLGLPETATEQQATAALAALLALKDRPLVPAALATALNLQAGADEAAVLAAVTALRTPDSSTTATIAALQGQVAQLTARLDGDQVTRTVDDAITAGKLLPAMRDWALNLGKVSMAQLSAYIAAAPVVKLDGQKVAGDPGSKTAPLAAETALMKGFGLTPEQFAAGAPAKAA